MKPVTFGGVLDEVPGLLGHLHLDEDVAGEAGLLANALLAVAARDSWTVSVGMRTSPNVGVLRVLLDALQKGLFDLVLVPRVGLDDVPLLGHFGAPASICLPSFQACFACQSSRSSSDPIDLFGDVAPEPIHQGEEARSRTAV